MVARHLLTIWQFAGNIGVMNSRISFFQRDWKDTNDFLERLAKKSGKLLKGGEPDVDNVAKMVLNDWQRGKLPFFTPPPGCEQLPQQPAAPEEAQEETSDKQEEETKAPTKDGAGDEGVSQNRTDENGADESLATETADESVVTEAADESAITGMTTSGLFSLLCSNSRG